jgi:hypothetical protein
MKQFWESLILFISRYERTRLTHLKGIYIKSAH